MDKQPGVLLDTRPEEEKAKDYKFEEIVAAGESVNWVEKSSYRKFPISDQDGSSSCVAQTLKKLQGIYIWLKTGAFVKLSASHIYQRRANRPGEGMAGVDAMEIGRKGVTLEEFAPSEKLTDAQMDSMNVSSFEDEVGKVFKLGNYVQLAPGNIDTVASIIQKTGKGVMVWFYFQKNEWTKVPTIENPTLSHTGAKTLRHSVAAVDFTLYKGKKALVIDDSWGAATALQGQRIITEDFFAKRNFFAAYFINFAFEGGAGGKPRYDGTIKSLQDCLKYEGTFPSNVGSTGVMGPITKKAVVDFQVKHGITPALGNVGPITTAKLQALYP